MGRKECIFQILALLLLHLLNVLGVSGVSMVRAAVLLLLRLLRVSVRANRRLPVRHWRCTSAKSGDRWWGLFLPEINYFWAVVVQ